MSNLRWFLPLLLGCGAAPSGDLDFVAVRGPGLTLSTARAEVDAFVLDDCEDGTVTVEVGDTLDLLHPAPFPVESGEYCAIGVDFTENPFDGSLRLSGATDAGTTFDLAIDPGLAVLEQAVRCDGDEGVLVLDLGLLLDAAALDAMGPEVEMRPDDSAAEALGDSVPDALWFGTPQEARGVWIDLWPFDDVDFEVNAHVEANVGGCGGGSGTPRNPEADADTDADSDADSDADTDADTDTDTDSDADTDADTDADSDSDADADSDSDADGDADADASGGCGGSGSSGGSSGGGSCDGGGCSGGGSCGGSACAVSSIVPPAWVSVAALVAVGRRRRRR